MYVSQETTGDAISTVYYFSFILVAFYFVIQLLLATITESYEVTEDSIHTGLKAFFHSLFKRLSKRSSTLKGLSEHWNSSKSHGNPDDEQRSIWDVTVWRKKANVIINTRTFQIICDGLVVCNTVVLALDHYPIEIEFALAIETANAVFTLIFIFEMVFKLFGLGLKDYLADRFNHFDGFISIASLIDLIIDPPYVFGGPRNIDVGRFTSMRALRIFRIFLAIQLILVPQKESMRIKVLLDTIMQTASAIRSFFILLFMLGEIYSMS
jgi:hypothetical protein